MDRRQSRNAVDTYVCKCDVCVKARKVESSHAELLEAAKVLLGWSWMLHEKQSDQVMDAIRKLREIATRATEEKQ